MMACLKTLTAMLMIVPLALGKACTYEDIDGWNSATMGITACSEIRGTLPSCTVCGHQVFKMKQEISAVEQDVSSCEEIVELYGEEKGIEKYKAGWSEAWEEKKEQLYEDIEASQDGGCHSAATSAFTGLAILLSLIATFGLL